MARRKKRRGLFSSFSSVKHPRFFKYLTIFGATLGILSSTVFSVLMGIDAVKGDLITDDVREYTASFSSEGSIISKTTYKRGELLEVPENPTHEIDGENNYFFIGWDTNKNGIPDVVPTRAYYSFDAEAVYFRTGKFDMNFLDLLNMDLEDLLQLLQNLNIDWEQFMSMFNIDPETLMQWLQSQMVLTFTTDPAPSSYPTYFRSTSYGDFDYGKKSFKNPDFYDSNLISDGSINPLSYTAYKLKKLDEANLLPNGFGFTNYNITFNAVEDYYPVPDCESSNDLEEIIDSDAHYLTKPKDNKYQTSAVYCPAFGYVIDLFDAIPLVGTVARDEKNYYRYALEHYTSIPNEYAGVIDDMIDENGWYEEELYQVDSIAAYVSGLGQCSLFNDDGSVDVNSYLNSQKKSKDPVMDLINNQKGSDLDFNTTAVMLFRRLHIPARLVKGYVSVGSQRGENSISLFNQHYWCEIYIKGTGWMICDCMDLSAITGTNPYKDMDQSNTPLENKHNLEKIKVTNTPIKTEYVLGEDLDLTGGSITAYFSDDTTSRVGMSASGITITGYNKDVVGPQYVTVSYTYEGVTKSDRFLVNVKEKEDVLESVTFNFDAVKTEYYVGDDFSLDKLVAMGHFDDGTEEGVDRNVTKDVKVTQDSDISISNPGEYVITVYVTEGEVTKTATYIITVLEDYSTDIEILTLPTKKSYFTGELLDITGLEVKVYKKSEKHETITYEGLARDNNGIGGVEFSIVEFNAINAHQEVTLSVWDTKNGMYHTTSFEVEVKENDMLSYQTYGFRVNYRIGEYFDVEAFKENAYIVCQMANEDTILVAENYNYTNNTTSTGYNNYVEYDKDYITPFTVTPPKLTTMGNATVTVSFNMNDSDYNIPVVISVEDLDTHGYVFNKSTSGSTAGPMWGNFEATPLFTFQTDHVGTMYFRNSSYSTYSPKGWSNTSNSTLTYSPNSFTYNKASQVYETSEVTINYLEDINYGLLPEYANSNSNLDNYETLEEKAAGTQDTYTFTNFALTNENVNRLTHSLIPYTGSVQTYANTYSNTQLSPYRTTYSNTYSLIQTYINRNDHMYNNIYDRVNLINRVKDDLYSEFTYNTKFEYSSSSQDPMVSFFNEKTGGSKEFATAATLIFRQLGVESRYVTGFGAYSNGSTTTVTTKNAHAWCEVYISDLGWVIVDPTNFDTGAKIDATGNYGTGFGGAGLYTFSKITYTGQVAINYNYGSKFEEDTETTANDPARWYTVYDDTDHHKIYSISVVNGSDALPNYLEYVVIYNWYRNDEYIGDTYVGNSFSGQDIAPEINYGQYVLVPTLEIYDKITGEFVTGEHNYTLAPGTQNEQFFIQPAIVYVYVYGTQDSYDMAGADSITLYTGKNSDIYFTTEVPDEIAALGIYDTLPNTVVLTIVGTFTYDGDGGTVTISYEDIDVVVSSYNGNNSWDAYNVFTVLYFGEVKINP